jgi:hypothetical protein
MDGAGIMFRVNKLLPGVVTERDRDVFQQHVWNTHACVDGNMANG